MMLCDKFPLTVKNRSNLMCSLVYAKLHVLMVVLISVCKGRYLTQNEALMLLTQLLQLNYFKLNHPCVMCPMKRL
jgi:hypothetical protein